MTTIEYIKISYRVTFLTPFHFGTGLRLGLIDRTVVRDHDGNLYLPGSTLKGIVRENCERLARLYEVLDDKMLDALASPHDKNHALWDLGRPPTMIARLFGSHRTLGAFFFDNALQTEQAKRQYDSDERDESSRGKYKDAQFDRYTQVRIDRRSRSAVPGALYTSEFGIRDLQLEGMISGWLECLPIEDIPGHPTYSLLLLLAGLHLLDRIGGNKSTGKGQCRCEIVALKRGNPLGIKSENKSQEDKLENVVQREQWKLWFEHLDALSYYSSQLAAQEEEA